MQQQLLNFGVSVSGNNICAATFSTCDMRLPAALATSNFSVSTSDQHDGDGAAFAAALQRQR